MVVTEVSILKAIGSALFAMATANGRTRSLRAGWHAVARKAELGRPMMCYCFTLPAYASGMSCWRWLRQSPTFPYRQGRDAMVFVRGLVFAVSFVIAAAAARAQTAAVSATCKDGSPWSGRPQKWRLPWSRRRSSVRHISCPDSHAAEPLLRSLHPHQRLLRPPPRRHRRLHSLAVLGRSG